jgi:hypothetical protein
VIIDAKARGKTPHMTVLDTLMNWVDVLWLPVAWMVALPHQRKWAIMFVVLCMVTMRLQSELIYSTGFNKGFTQLLSSDVQLRATFIYGVFTLIYLLILYFSPRSGWAVLMSASIVIYFTAFIVSMLAMTV